MKKFLLINILLLSVFCVNVCAKKPVNQKKNVQYEIDVSDTIIYSFVEVIPQFVGGEKALYKWVNDNMLSCPPPANCITGKVLVNFVIEKDGSITNVKVTKSVHPLLDNEAIRLVKSMPKWLPAIKDNKVVRCYFTLPINFILK